MSTQTITRPLLACRKCKNEWYPRVQPDGSWRIPAVCPACHNRKWTEEKKAVGRPRKEA